MKHWRLEAIILAIGMVVAGMFIKTGMSTDRVVHVKGLAQREVAANHVVWPLAYKMVGNDLSVLYREIKQTNRKIKRFLVDKGIDESEIGISAPKVIDMKAEMYVSQKVRERYNITSVLTVSSEKVDVVRQLITEQTELLNQGIALSSDDYNYRVVYQFTELNKIKPKMIEEATVNARAAAEKFAKDSNSTIGGIRSANQGQFTISNRDNNTPYIKTVRVVTTIDYLLKN